MSESCFSLIFSFIFFSVRLPVKVSIRAEAVKTDPLFDQQDTSKNTEQFERVLKPLLLFKYS
jgi:hypothetical protein